MTDKKRPENFSHDYGICFFNIIILMISSYIQTNTVKGCKQNIHELIIL